MKYRKISQKAYDEGIEALDEIIRDIDVEKRHQETIISAVVISLLLNILTTALAITLNFEGWNRYVQWALVVITSILVLMVFRSARTKAGQADRTMKEIQMLRDGIAHTYDPRKQKKKEDAGSPPNKQGQNS